LILGACSKGPYFLGLESAFDNSSLSSESPSTRVLEPPAKGAYDYWPVPAAITPLPDIELQVTAEVEQQLQLYLKRGDHFIKRALLNREPHYDVMKLIFADEGMPGDLLNVALIESGFRNQAVSRGGAVGMWQFTSATAKRYGLKIDSQVDQRKDTVHATLAAARHLKDLFLEHGDWYLALAAYNAGSGRVLKALNWNDDFWKLSRSKRLPRQTALFVPRFIAATILVKAADKFGTQDLARRVRLSISPSKEALKGEQFAFMVSADEPAGRIKNRPGSGLSSAG